MRSDCTDTSSDVITNRRQTPTEDLVGALVAAQEGDRSLSHEEVLGFCFLLLIAGNETTTKLIGNALFWLEAFPHQRARLLADPSLIPAAVEETLRFDTSTQALARVLDARRRAPRHHAARRRQGPAPLRVGEP